MKGIQAVLLATLLAGCAVEPRHGREVVPERVVSPPPRLADGGPADAGGDAELPESALVDAIDPADPHAIRAVDFANRVYDGCYGRVRTRAGGHDLTVDGALGASFAVSLPLFADVTGDGRDDAVMRTFCWGGGSGRFTDVIVVAADGDHTRVIDTHQEGDRSAGGILKVSIDGHDLVLLKAGNDHDAACCTDFHETVRLRWNGSELAQVGAAKRTRVKR